MQDATSTAANFEQHLAHDTTRIRHELGYRELVGRVFRPGGSRIGR